MALSATLGYLAPVITYLTYNHNETRQNINFLFLQNVTVYSLGFYKTLTVDTIQGIHYSQTNTT